MSNRGNILFRLTRCMTIAATGAAVMLAVSASAAPLKVAFLLPGSASDGGYNADGARTAEAIKTQLHADTKIIENVSVANQADLYRQSAAAGYDLVVGWGGQFSDGAVQVAQEFPDVKFLIVNGIATNDRNLASLDEDVEQWEFVSGFVAAKLSKSDVIGWIGGQCFPPTAALLHGVEQGAKYANPKVRVLATYTGDFEDPTKAQAVAQAMIESGAKALLGNLNSGHFGVIKAAQTNGNIPVITEWADNHQLAPAVIASSTQKSQVRFVLQVVKTVADGTFKGKHHRFGFPADWGPVMAKTSLLPDDVYKASLDVQKQIAEGKIHVAHDTACPK